MEQKQNHKKKNLTKLWILAVLVILCLVYFLVPPVNAYVNQVASVLGSANVDAVVAFIRSYGAYAMAFSFALMVFQSVAGGHPVLDQLHGRGGPVLLSGPGLRPGYGGEICRQGGFGQRGGLL